MMELKAGMRFKRCGHLDRDLPPFKLVALRAIKANSFGLLNEETNEVETGALDVAQVQATIIMLNLREIR